MASPSLAARAAILGVPYQPGKRPDPLGVVKAFEALDAKAMATSSGAIVRDTLVDLNAVSNPPAHQIGWVTGDATPAKNGIYENTGSPSAPNWQRRADLPFGVIHMINVGTGTPNAIIATSSLPVPTTPGTALFTVNIVADNTGPVTINGKPWLTNVGNEFVAGGIKAGGIYLFLDNGDHYRAVTDQDVSALVVAAEEAAIRAEIAAGSIIAQASFKTVSALLADDNNLIGYAGSGASITVTPGDIVNAQGFRYEVAASGASDYHVETAGGVRLRFLPNADGSFNIDAAGADPTGALDSTEAVIAAASYAATRNLKLVGAGQVRLSGNTNIDIVGNADLSQVTFLLADFNGELVIRGRKQVTTYPTGSSVVALLLASNLSARQSVFSGWSGLEEVEDAMVIIRTAEPFYRYRGIIINRREVMRSYKDGVVSSPLLWGLNNIESVDVIPMEEAPTLVKLNIDVRGNQTSNRFVRVSTNRATVEINVIQDRLPNTTNNPSHVFLEWCADSYIKLIGRWPNRTASEANGNPTGYTYNLEMRDCFDVIIEAQADGDGWGATGSNGCARITFQNSRINRIDFHNPVREWLKVIDCVLGNFGILLSIIGDLYCERVTWVNRTQENVNNRGYIRTRGDTGGFAEGRLIIRDCVAIDDRAANVQFIEHQQESGNGKPTGSPLPYRFWSQVIIDGLDATQTTGLFVNPLNINRSATFSAPAFCAEEITMKNLRGPIYAGLTIKSDSTSYLAAPYNVRFTVEDSAIRDISCVAPNGFSDVSVLANYRNVRPYSQGIGLNIEQTAAGRYVIDSGDFNSLDFFSGGSTNNPIEVVATGSAMRKIGATQLINGIGPNCDIRLNDCIFRVADMSDLAVLLRSIMKDPRFIVAGADATYILTNTLNGSGTFTLAGNIREGQTVNVLLGSGANSAYVPVRIPRVGRKTTLLGVDGAGAVTNQLATMSRTSATEIVVAGANFRRLDLGRESDV